MPSVGRPAATRSRSASSSEAVRSAGHRAARGADAGEHGQVRRRRLPPGRSSAKRVAPEPLEREPDRAHVAGAVVADSDPRHSTPFVDGTPLPSGATAARSARPTALNAASAQWWRRARSPRRGSRAAPACARLASMCAARPGSRSRLELCPGAAAEVDGGARERVVHRHDRVAVASDAAAVAERDGRAPRRVRARRPRPCGARRSRGRRRPRARGRARAWNASCSSRWS